MVVYKRRENEPEGRGAGSVNREKQEYDPFATPMLDVRDLLWLSEVTHTAPQKDFLLEANEMISAGTNATLPKQNKLRSERAKTERNLAARTRFFEMLGWLNEEHPLHDSFRAAKQTHERLPSLDHFVFVQRALFQYRIHPEQIIMSEPQLVYYTPHTVVDTLRAYENTGMDPTKLLNNKRYHHLITHRAPTIMDTTKALEDAGIQPASKALTRATELYDRSGKDLKKHMTKFRRKKFDPVKIAASEPRALNIPPQLLDSKMASLKAMGLDPTRIISRYPGVLLYNTATIELKLNALESRGIDWYTLIHRQPSLLKGDVDKIAKRIRLIKGLAYALRWNGDVDELLAAQPVILESANTKLLFLAQIGATHLDKKSRNLTHQQVGDALWAPLSAHVLAAARPRIQGGYSITRAKHYQRNMETKNREFAAINALQDPTAERRIGVRAVRAYRRHMRGGR